jgi:hypothetical protein
MTLGWFGLYNLFTLKQNRGISIRQVKANFPW